jgi:hypothetical protein
LPTPPADPQEALVNQQATMERQRIMLDNKERQVRGKGGK